MEWKKFAMLTGWSNQQPNLRSTGHERRVQRLGRFHERPLVSDYAHQSPEEAFAEYYSFYYLHSEAINNWLKSGDENFIKRDMFLAKRRKRITKKDPVTGETKFVRWQEKEYEARGLGYLHVTVPIEVLRRNKEPLMQMRKIFKHKELIKALNVLGLV